MESQIVVNILTCISQENHKSCYTPSFPRFHQELIVVVLDYSFSIFILIFFLWICITLASLSSEGKNLLKKERLNIWIICNEMSPSQQILVLRMSRGRPTSKTSPKDPISPPQGRPNLTSWGRPEMASRWHSNLTSKGPPREGDLGCPTEDLQSTQTWMSQNFFQLFFQNLLDWPNLPKSFSTLKVYSEPSQTSRMERFLRN